MVLVVGGSVRVIGSRLRKSHRTVGAKVAAGRSIVGASRVAASRSVVVGASRSIVVGASRSIVVGASRSVVGASRVAASATSSRSVVVGASANGSRSIVGASRSIIEGSSLRMPVSVVRRFWHLEGRSSAIS
jgi:hypothetical protein